MVPISKHFYPKCQGKDPKCHNMWRHLVQGRLWWINSSNESISWLNYGSVPIWTSHAGNQLGTDGNLSCCGWLWHLLTMKANKIEGPLTHAVNAQINMIWWLNISQYSMWCANSSLDLPIGAACHMQSLVFKFDYTDKCHSITMYH